MTNLFCVKDNKVVQRSVMKAIIKADYSQQKKQQLTVFNEDYNPEHVSKK